MPAIPTVKIKADNARGCMVINESDFDADVHEVWEAADMSSETEADAPDEAEVAIETAPALPDNKSDLIKIALDMGLKVLARDTVSDLTDKITEARESE